MAPGRGPARHAIAARRLALVLVASLAAMPGPLAQSWEPLAAVPPGKTLFWRPKLSPDATEVFVVWRWLTPLDPIVNEVVRMRIDGSGSTRLYLNLSDRAGRWATGLFPAASDDGSVLVAPIMESAPFQFAPAVNLYVIDRAGTRRALTSDAAPDLVQYGEPAVSGDGTRWMAVRSTQRAPFEYVYGPIIGGPPVTVRAANGATVFDLLRDGSRAILSVDGARTLDVVDLATRSTLWNWRPPCTTCYVEQVSALSHLSRAWVAVRESLATGFVYHAVLLDVDLRQELSHVVVPRWPPAAIQPGAGEVLCYSTLGPGSGWIPACRWLHHASAREFGFGSMTPWEIGSASWDGSLLISQYASLGSLGNVMIYRDRLSIQAAQRIGDNSIGFVHRFPASPNRLTLGFVGRFGPVLSRPPEERPWLLDPLTMSLVFQSAAPTGGSGLLALPNDTSLVGSRFALQSLSLVGSGAAMAVEFSNGVPLHPTR